MGTGIAYVSAVNAGLKTIIYDVSPSQLRNSQTFITSLLNKEISKGRLNESDKEKHLSRLSFAPLDLVAGRVDDNIDFFIEATTENFDIKKNIFSFLSSKSKPSSILASNTSSISITKIAKSAEKRAHQVVGMHFMNPVPVMKLVEIIRGLQTDDHTLTTTLQLAEAMGKVCSRSNDVPGFIANRLLMPYINEAIFALQDGIGSREDIDVTMKLGTNMPMGPLQLADFIGLDTCLSIMQTICNGLGDSKYRPAPLLVKYVDAGWLGKKTGRGFYTYDDTNTMASSSKKQ